MASFKALALGCCLLALTAGCRFHRTCRGFSIQGQPWSLTFDRGCIMESEADAMCIEEVAEKPELIPWRNRLKGYRLAARLGRHEHTELAESTIQIPAPPGPERPDLVME